MEIEYKYEDYADSVLNKKIVVGEAIYLACKRYKEWKNRKDIYFDKDDVERKIRLISKLKHFTGVHNGKPFILLVYILVYIKVLHKNNIFHFNTQDIFERNYECVG
jgi:hypothetical protein